MFEFPDKRAFYMLTPVVGLGFGFLMVPAKSSLALPLERALYLAMVMMGLGFVALDLNEGYCLNRPSITRDESPIQFWIEVFASFFVGVIAGYKLWQLF